MHRITSLFQRKKEPILSVYFTAGYPSLNDTFRTITELEKHGVDMVEIGIPFSDPIADGPVIQKSSSKALLNGMNLSLLFDQLREIREFTEIPLVLMGYLNPVMKMGMENFVRRTADTGIDGVIIPDLPPEVYREEYYSLFREAGIFNNFLITPQSSEERLRQLDEWSEGFLYMVSTAATTGMRDSFTDDQIGYFRRMQEMNLVTPRLAGFGISNRTTFEQACRYSRGAIIGSTFIEAVSGEGTLSGKVSAFIETLQ